MTRRIASAMIIGLALGVAAFAACTDAEDERAPQPSPSLPATPAPTEPGGGPTGITSVDRAIAAVEAGDVDAFMALVNLREEPCAPPADGLGGPPECLAGEAPNTPVAVAPFASCEGYWARAASLRTTLTPLFDRPTRLYGVWKDGGNRLFDRTGSYALIFESTGGPEGQAGRFVVMTDDGVVGVNFGCGQTAEQLVEFSKLAEAIVEPAASAP